MFSSGGNAAWVFAGLAIVIVGLVSWLLGRSIERTHQRHAVHQARQAARLQRELAHGVTWRTDAQHRLLEWHAVDASSGTVVAAGAKLASLFGNAGDGRAAFTAALVAERPAGPIGLVAASPSQLGGSRWTLSALPCFDAEGRFDGHLGAALCVDSATAAAVEPDTLSIATPAALPPPPVQAAALTSDLLADPFSLTVAHDLRAPIRVVEGFARIVKEDYGSQLDRVANDHLDRVLGAATRMNLMIDALLTMARLSSQPLARQPVNLSQLAGYVVEDLRRSAPEREVDFDIEPGLTAHGDPTLLRLVLENLLGNAWKYTGRTARAQIRLGRVAAGTVGAGGLVLPTFEVRDNGAGFDMRHAERLFGLFQRLHSANDFPGHGVGLASVKRIVQRHGGDIWAEAEPGRGAAFVFTLAP